MQLGWPDMKLPILYTMSWPERVNCSEATWPRLDFIKVIYLCLSSLHLCIITANI